MEVKLYFNDESLKGCIGVHLNVNVQPHLETILNDQKKPKCSHECRILCNQELIG